MFIRARTRRRTRQFFAFPPFSSPAIDMTIKWRVLLAIIEGWVRVRVVAIMEVRPGSILAKVLPRVLGLMLVYLINYLTYFMARIRIEDFEVKGERYLELKTHSFYPASCGRGTKPPCIFAWFIVYMRRASNFLFRR